MSAARAEPPAPPPAAPRRSPLLSPWLPPLVGLLCMANSAFNSFTYDDLPLVAGNPRIRSLANWDAIWLTNWWAAVDESADVNLRRDLLYRPLTHFTLAVNFALHGLWPAGFHLTNVLLHAGVCAAVWLLARRLTGDLAVASVAGVLFAVHPVHAEAVANVVGRAEVLAALFLILGSLVLLPRGSAEHRLAGVSPSPLPAGEGSGRKTAGAEDPPTRRRTEGTETGRYTEGTRRAAARTASGEVRDDIPAAPAPGFRRALIAAGLFCLALLSKETAICYPAIGLLVLFAGQIGRQRRPGPAWWLMHAGVLLLPLLIYFPMRYVALDGRLLRATPAGTILNPVVLAEGTERVWAALTVFGHYVRLLAVPAKLSSDYGLAVIDPRQGFTPMTAVGLLAGLGLAVGLTGFVRGQERWRRVAVLCGLWVASYALISNTVLLIGVAAAERLMYWPSVVALLLAAVGVVAFWRRFCAPGGTLAGSARVLRLLGVLFVFSLGLRTVMRNVDWRNNLTLAQSDVRTFPASAQLQRGLARSLLDVAEISPPGEQRDELLSLADVAATRALEIEPSFTDALVIRAQVHALLDDTDAAFLYAEAALRLDPHHENAQEVLARLQGVADLERQLEAHAQRVATAPQDAGVRLEYGRALLTYGRPLAARAQLERVRELDPGNLDALRLLSQALAGSGALEEARRVCRQVLERDPNDWESHANLAFLLARDDPQRALEHARRAAELQPNDLRVRINLAESYAAAGDRARAIELFERLLHDLDADDPYRAVVRSKIRDLRR